MREQRRPGERRDPYSVKFKLKNEAGTERNNMGRWLMEWTAPYGISVPE